MRHKGKTTERHISGCRTAIPLFRHLSALVFLFSVLACASCAAIRPMPSGYENSLTVTASAYNSLPGQTDGSPKVGAWGDRIAPGVKAIAVSHDLGSLGLRRGTKVRIQGRPGEYVVLDIMPARWKRHIDIYMGDDVKAARSWGRRKVKIWWTNVERSQSPSMTSSPVFSYSRDATPHDSPVYVTSWCFEPKADRVVLCRFSRLCTRGSERDLRFQEIVGDVRDLLTFIFATDTLIPWHAKPA
jgi:3D (Asp-Asp-Asp) domain-containing protein